MLQLTKVEFIMEKLDKIETEESPDKIVDGLIRLAKKKSHCDNMAIILVVLKKGAYHNSPKWIIYCYFLMTLCNCIE